MTKPHMDYIPGGSWNLENPSFPHTLALPLGLEPRTYGLTDRRYQPAELREHMAVPRGFEPLSPAWQADILGQLNYGTIRDYATSSRYLL